MDKKEKFEKLIKKILENPMETFTCDYCAHDPCAGCPHVVYKGEISPNSCGLEKLEECEKLGKEPCLSCIKNEHYTNFELMEL
jgi:hypothetical protein